MNERMNVPLSSGDEYDALTRSKRYLHWAAGERKAIKRGYNKRNRKAAKQELRDHR